MKTDNEEFDFKAFAKQAGDAPLSVDCIYDFI